MQITDVQMFLGASAFFVLGRCPQKNVPCFDKIKQLHEIPDTFILHFAIAVLQKEAAEKQ
ncbi:hypothetical protein [Mucilaginibacter gotjawali]|uniref:hypothetical protein n=1 Tax=Mucilaginibacter gotjawali TaxID=1550579 RepID=UPI0012FDB8A2|nr:hypothetical protein [Mucilaginibacter gotjawali]